MNSEKETVLVLRWIIFTIIGGMIGSLLGSEAGEKFGFSLGYILENIVKNKFILFPSGYLPSIVAGFVYGAVIGVFLGFFQWIKILRNCYKNSHGWIFLNIIGYALALSLNSGVFVYLISNLGSSLYVNIIGACISGLTTGLFVGLLEWRFFSSKHTKSIWWLVLNIIGWTLLDLVIGTVGITLGAGSKFWVEVVFAMIINLGIAVFTSIAFYITLPSTSPEIKLNTIM